MYWFGIKYSAFEVRFRISKLYSSSIYHSKIIKMNQKNLFGMMKYHTWHRKYGVDIYWAVFEDDT